MKQGVDLGISGNNLVGSHQAAVNKTPVAVTNKSAAGALTGSVQGSHYDPHSAFNNPDGRQRRPAPVGNQPYGSATAPKISSKIGGQPTQKKKQSIASSAAGGPSRSQSHQVSVAASNNIVKMSEIEELRNYNAMMNEKLRQRDVQAATEIVAAAQPPQQLEEAHPVRQDSNPFHSSLPSAKLEGALAGAALGGLSSQQPEPAASLLQSGYGGSTSQQQMSTQYPQPIQSVVNPTQTIYPRTHDRDKHHLSIVGSHKLAAQTSLHQDAVQFAQDKESKQREFAAELQRQIEERDAYRQKQNQPQPFRRSPIKTQYQQPDLMVTGQGQHAQKTSFYPPDDRTFYMNGAGPSAQPALAAQTRATHFDASITKQVFPEMKTRGRVLEGRVDLELENNGNILTQGRNESAVMQNKREAEQAAMREALQQQIDEKNRKREEARQLAKRDEIRDEIRVREQMHAMAVAEGKATQEDAPDVLAPMKHLSDALVKESTHVSGSKTNYNTNADANGNQMNFMAQQTMGGSRKTAYAANQHSVSIIGSDIGTQHLPHNFAQPSPAFAQTGEENLANLLASTASPKGNQKLALEQVDEEPPSVNASMARPQMAVAQTRPEEVGQPDFERDDGSVGALSPKQRSPLKAAPTASLQIAGQSLHERAPDQGEHQITELNSMVQQLLQQQAALKEQLQKSKIPPKQPQGGALKPMNLLVKKSSERVPRSKDGPGGSLSFGGRADAGTPGGNKKATESRAKQAEMRRKQRQEMEKEKIDRIEAKIQKARQRRGEESRVRSQVARQTQKRRTAPTSGQDQVQAMAEELGLAGAGADLLALGNPEREVKAAWDEKRFRGGRPPAAPSIKSYGSRHSLQNAKGAGTESRQSLGLHGVGVESEQARPVRQRPSNLESPGKLSLKVGSLGGGEKELAHESHLIHNNEQQPHSHIGHQEFDQITAGSGPGARGPMLTHYQNQAPLMGAQQSAYPPGGSKSHQNVPLSWQQETSFDMEFMMPPDITSIDSDINKIGALTPSPFLGDFEQTPFNLTANQNMGQAAHRQGYPQQRGLMGAPPTQSVYPVLNSGGAGNFGGPMPNQGGVQQQNVPFGFGQQPYYQRAPGGFDQKQQYQQYSGSGSGAGARQFYQSSYQGGTTTEGTSLGGPGAAVNQF